MATSPNKPVDQRRFRILKVSNVNNCVCGHHTHYRLETTDGLNSFCMICFALGWHDTQGKILELTGATKMPGLIENK